MKSLNEIVGEYFPTETVEKQLKGRLFGFWYANLQNTLPLWSPMILEPIKTDIIVTDKKIFIDKRTSRRRGIQVVMVLALLQFFYSFPEQILKNPTLSGLSSSLLFLLFGLGFSGVVLKINENLQNVDVIDKSWITQESRSGKTWNLEGMAKTRNVLPESLPLNLKEDQTKDLSFLDRLVRSLFLGKNLLSVFSPMKFKIKIWGLG